jgi:prepilin-type N-terminal cleavage/methylation domain-containing protein
MQPASSRGFTLIEVVVALAILAGVLASLPTVLLQVERAAAAARRSVVASIAAADKLEQLRGLAWGFDANGARVEDVQSDASRSPVSATGGAGLALSPGDSLDADVPGFVDYLDEDGRWVAGAASEGRGVALVRRWSVARPPEAPADTLLLCVRVLAVPARAGGPPPAELARLATLKSRRAR